MTLGKILMHHLLFLFWGAYGLVYAASPSSYIYENRAKPQTQAAAVGLVLNESGEPLVGVSILEVGTSNETYTDIDGKFSLTLKKDSSVLVFSFSGYENQELAASKDMKVVMEKALNILDQVVLTGYGSNNKKVVTAAIENVSLDRVADRNIKSAQEYLQGQVSGVTVMNSGGSPDQTPSITIRGVASTNGSDPLWIVDGVPYYGPPINPQDIKTMTVIKDASAAIYGARAAGGVILVETKGGGKEGKTTINVRSYTGIKQVRNLPAPLTASEFLNMQQKAITMDGNVVPDYYMPSKNPGKDIDVTKTNWLDEIFRLGQLQNHSISIAHGGQKLSSYSSLDYLKEDGVMINTKYQRFNFRTNATYTPNKKFKADFRVNANYSDANGAGQNLYDGPVFLATAYPRALTVYDDLGNFRGIDLPGGTRAYGDLVNPVARLARLDNKQPRLDLLSSLGLSYEFFEGFSYQLNASANGNWYNPKEFVPKIPEPGKPNSQNYLNQRSEQTIQLLLENLVRYKKAFGEHNIDALVGYTYQDRSSNYFLVQGQGFDLEDPSTRYLSSYTTINTNKEYTTGGAWQDVLISYMGKASYNYAEKYIASVIIRRDGSSRLNKNDLFQWFPSFSLGYNIAKEDFFKVDFISDLKLRASWGQVGNINSLNNYYGTIPTLSAVSTIFGSPSSLTSGYLLNTVNKDLRWETVEQADIGVDIALFKDRLNITVDYYDKKTKDMILQPTLLGTAGVNESPYINAGTITNQGLEFSAKYLGNVSDFKYTLEGNITYNQNTINRLYDTNFIQTTSSIRDMLTSRNQVGSAVYSYYGYKTAGLFQSQAEIDSYVDAAGSKLQPNARPGDLKFVDVDGDNKITGKDQMILGNPFPKISYNFRINLNYKHFDLSLFLQGVADVKLVNALKYTGYNASVQQYNRLSQIKDAWTPEHTNTSIPRLSKTDPNGNFSKFSDFYVEDGSYLRLKNVTLGYTLPASLKIPVQSFRVYASVDNVLTFTKYSGIDPEVGLASRGIDMGIYPLSAIYSIGLNVQF